MTRTPSTELALTTTGSGGYVDTFEEAVKVPHLEVTLPHNSSLNGIESTLAEACCGLLLGEKPSVFLDRKNYVAVIPVPSDRIERVLYKSYILHKTSGARYPCKFRVGEANSSTQRKVTIELPGAKFAWLKAQAHIRDRLYSYEPLIRVNWQQCTGAETCKIHLHYSSEAESLLTELGALEEWIETESNKVVVRSFPLYVPPRNRFGLSSDGKFREIAYTNGVSLWTRTMKDSPLGNEWCTLATDDPEAMEATLQAYIEFGQTTKWGAKSNASSPSQSPPNDSPLSSGGLVAHTQNSQHNSNNRSRSRSSRSGSGSAAAAAAAAPPAAAAAPSPASAAAPTASIAKPAGERSSGYNPKAHTPARAILPMASLVSDGQQRENTLSRPPGLFPSEIAPSPFAPRISSTITPSWGLFSIPTDVDYYPSAADSPAATVAADWKSIFSPSPATDFLLEDPFYISLTDSTSEVKSG